MHLGDANTLVSCEVSRPAISKHGTKIELNSRMKLDLERFLSRVLACVRKLKRHQPKSGMYPLLVYMNAYIPLPHFLVPFWQFWVSERTLELTRSSKHGRKLVVILSATQAWSWILSRLLRSLFAAHSCFYIRSGAQNLTFRICGLNITIN